MISIKIQAGLGGQGTNVQRNGCVVYTWSRRCKGGIVRAVIQFLSDVVAIFSSSFTPSTVGLSF